jgi:hypothetical protein
MRGISWITEQLSASQEGLCSMELVILELASKCRGKLSKTHLDIGPSNRIRSSRVDIVRQASSGQPWCTVMKLTARCSCNTARFVTTVRLHFGLKLEKWGNGCTKRTIFWNVTPCRLVEAYVFRREILPLSSKSKSKQTIRKQTLKTEAVHASETSANFYQTLSSRLLSKT